MLVGDKIKEYRTVLNLSQEDLAHQMNTSRQTISSWENEKTYPGLEEIVSLCDIFQISVQTFIEEDVRTMKQIINSKSDRVMRNKSREAINKLVALRFICVLAGALFIFPVYEYFEIQYLIIPGSLLLLGAILTVPIEVYRSKYKLREYQEIVSFFDEKYNH